MEREDARGAHQRLVGGQDHRVPERLGGDPPVQGGDRFGLGAVGGRLAHRLQERAGRARIRLARLPVVADLAAASTFGNAGGLDGIMLTDTQSPQASFDRLSSLAELSGLPRNAVVAPSVLRISPVTAPISSEPVL